MKPASEVKAAIDHPDCPALLRQSISSTLQAALSPKLVEHIMSGMSVKLHPVLRVPGTEVTGVLNTVRNFVWTRPENLRRGV